MHNRKIKLHHPTGHPYWNKEEYKIELPNGNLVNPLENSPYNSYRIFFNDSGIWAQMCACGSGYGKVDIKNLPPKLLVSKEKYDTILFVGKPLDMSESLKQELIEQNK